jgi:tRNA(adenine34) deaminase
VNAIKFLDAGQQSQAIDRPRGGIASRKTASQRVLFSCDVATISAIDDAAFMKLALQEAQAAADAEEVPVGAILVRDGQVLSRGNNRTLRDCDPTAHAEIVALREASRAVANHRLAGTTMYVTIEPCAMCAGAIIQARVARVVYGADDPKGGAVRSCFEVLSHPRLNHQVQIAAGLFAEESATLLQKFFGTRR